MLHHPALYTTSVDVVAGIGVKSAQTHKRGDFLGFYTGQLVPEDAYDASSYGTIAFEIKGTSHLIVPGKTDLMRYVNEPPISERANAVAVPLHLCEGNAIAFYACDEIAPNVEIWAHYGAKFSRDYAVGSKRAAPRTIQNVDAVIDQDALSQLDRYCAPRTGMRSRLG